MTKRPMKGCSTLLAHKEMQVKTTETQNSGIGKERATYISVI